MSNLNFNSVTIAGRLTADPELKQTQSGTSVTTFTIAINRKKSKEGEQTADFITCVAWKERAELITKYFHKGSCIMVSGRLQTRKRQDQNGNNRSATEVLVNEVYFVDSKADNSEPTASAEANFTELDEGSDLPF